MSAFSKTIPTAPYRVLEAIWYNNQLGNISEHQFQFPYLKESSLNLDDGTEFKLILNRLTGTKLDFLISDGPGRHSALISVSAEAVNKNVTKTQLVMTQSSLNGTTETVVNWLDKVLNKVENYFKNERMSA